MAVDVFWKAMWGTMSDLSTEAVVGEVVIAIATPSVPSEEALKRVETLLTMVPPEQAVILMAGQAVTLLQLLAEVQGHPLNEVVDRYGLALNIARLDRGLEDQA